MIGSVAYVADRRPTMAFLALWKAAGGEPGLPGWMVVTDGKGGPTATFTALCRQAFGLAPGEGLSPSVPIFDEAGKPTVYMIDRWALWTS